jgi:hypothetical protein
MSVECQGDIERPRIARYDLHVSFSMRQPLPWAIVIGDGVMHLLVTLLGFASHDTLQGESLTRILATFVPFFIAWLVVALWLGLFSRSRLMDPHQLWRPPLAAVLAAPFGGFVRGLWLQSGVVPTFILVMAGVTAVGMFIWRGALLLHLRRR